MIYLQNITTAQTVTIPRTTETQGAMSMILRSTVDNSIVTQTGVVNTANSRLYWEFAVTLPAGLDRGEYQYEVTQGGETIACGLATIGDYVRESADYHKTIQYGQYQSES